MAVVLHYFDGRGFGERIRIALCGAGIEFTEVFLTEREEFLKLIADNRLPFNQVPLLEIDGMELVQSNAITNYISKKGNLNYDDDKRYVRVCIMYEGAKDFASTFLPMSFQNEEDVYKNIQDKVLPRYLPAFNKALEQNGTGFVVGERLTMADLGLFEALLATLDYFEEEIFDDYPQIKKFVEMMKSREDMEIYLTKYRKPKNNRALVETAERVLAMKF